MRGRRERGVLCGEAVKEREREVSTGVRGVEMVRAKERWGGESRGGDELGCLYLWDSAQTTTTTLGSGRCEVSLPVTQASTWPETRY